MLQVHEMVHLMLRRKVELRSHVRLVHPLLKPRAMVTSTLGSLKHIDATRSIQVLIVRESASGPGQTAKTPWQQYLRVTALPQ